jgi:hypothetical protein
VRCGKPPHETILRSDENVLKQKPAYAARNQSAGFDHVVPPQRNLQAIPEGRASRFGK